MCGSIISNGIERRWKRKEGRKRREREREVNRGKDEIKRDEMKTLCDRAKTDGKRRSKKEKESKKEK